MGADSVVGYGYRELGGGAAGVSLRGGHTKTAMSKSKKKGKKKGKRCMQAASRRANR